MPPPLQRLMLWIDNVGGFLILPTASIRVGQQLPQTQVELPLMADIARHHATLRRDAESYLVEPISEVALDGNPTRAAAVLQTGSTLTLGRSTQLRFVQPHPLSATARLDVVSRHRTHPAADGVILLADTCVLGPAANCHIVCRHWSDKLVLYWQAGSLYCVGDGTFRVNGTTCNRRAILTPGAHVAGVDFTFSLEVA